MEDARSTSQPAAEDLEDPTTMNGSIESGSGAATPHSPNPSNASNGAANRASPQVSALVRKSGVRYVNGMRNIGWIAGLVHQVDERTVMVQQTANLETAVRATLDPSRFNPSRMHGRLLTLQFHVYGYRNEYGPQAGLQIINIDRPSVLDLPAQKVWASGFGKDPKKAAALQQLAAKSVSLFDENGQIRPEFRPFVIKNATPETDNPLTPQAQRYVQALRMFGDIMEASGGLIDSRLGAGSNYVTLAGFLDSKAFVPPTEHRQGYGLLLLRQQQRQEENIPIRVRDPAVQRLLQGGRLWEGMPILVNGIIRRKVYPKDDAPHEIASAHTYVECIDISDIKAAAFGHDLLATPPWWEEIRQRLLARKEQALQQQTAASAPEVVDDL